jgi:polyisoprenoid-binding protein YceI
MNGWRVTSRSRPGPRWVALVLALCWPRVSTAEPERQRYRIDVPRSRFVVNTETTGMSSMFGHDHKIQVGNYEGTVTVTPGAVESAALDLMIWADSLHAFEEEHEDISWEIDVALRDHVLHTRKFPKILFSSRSATAQKREDGSLDVTLIGELQLHGVRRRVTVPLRLQFQAGTLRASGAVSLRQSDYKIPPFSFGGGTASIADRITLSFDIVAYQERQQAQERKDVR